MERASQSPSQRVVASYIWGDFPSKNVWMHDWGLVLDLPYFLYQQPEAALQKVVDEGPGLPVLENERYTEGFAQEFYCIRRPGYCAILYTGPANATDDGMTNYRNMFAESGYLGGHFNGFAGGGMSAFWTPTAGTLLVGRISSYEAYERQHVQLKDGGKYIIPGWQDWANNHIIGQTQEGKILTSARTSRPKSTLSADKASLEIEGVILGELRRQGLVTDAKVSYRRVYRFTDSQVSATSPLS